MAEYLEREAVVKYLLSRKGDFLDDYGKGWSAGIGAASGICGEFPAADVAPVVKGEWEFSHTSSDGFAVVKCSNCGHEAFAMAIYVKEGHYCPYCGAKMDREEKEP